MGIIIAILAGASAATLGMSQRRALRMRALAASRRCPSHAPRVQVSPASETGLCIPAAMTACTNVASRARRICTRLRTQRSRQLSMLWRPPSNIAAAAS
ncbi:hypothetical protein [Xanthomonas sp. MLO165]|uniref:hypothetical protein n=1 Tax=Xanthomonas sp. MLO165 TaxID=2081477 RepID=UPI0012DB2439|nr:hypothetical protein [Xanthomonas sp. MLO165]